MHDIRQKLNLDLYKIVYLIRQSEQAIIDNYRTDEMKTPMHMSMGSEAISAGACLALGSSNQVYGTYRSHAVYLAKTLETDQFFAEMYGKAAGIIKGKGGSMHLSYPERGFLASSAVVASTIPLAVGTAFVNKVTNNKKIVSVFFGDGAVDEGVFWESLNFACLRQLPMLFICEDNGLAVHNPSFLRHGYREITTIVSKFNCLTFKSSSTDPEIIFKLTQKAMELTLKLSKPVFLLFRYYRYLEHVGVFEDFQTGYRSRDEFKKWYKKDPVNLQKRKLTRLGITNKQILNIENQINNQIKKSLAFSKQAPFPKEKELYKDVFYEN